MGREERGRGHEGGRVGEVAWGGRRGEGEGAWGREGR